MINYDDLDNFSQSDYYIEYSIPKKDCKFCRIRNYADSSQQYAVCVCPVLCKGLVSVDISVRSIPFQSIYSCSTCKYYISVNQLSLF